MQTLTHLFTALHAWLFELLVQPAMHALGLASFTELAFDATEVVLIGAIEVAVLALFLGALERWRPVEPVTDRAAVRTDVLYTLLQRLGIVSLLTFTLLSVPFAWMESQLRLAGFIPPKLEDAWPALMREPLASFLVYLVILDFVGYWVHRGQHQLRWWWALHSLHHSQRQMTFWTDSRNHLLDDVIGAAIAATVALLIGVAPAQFVTIVVLSRVVESLSHANLRMSFGWLGSRLLVSPQFHRIHHAIGDGHEGRYGGVNFAVLFPVWDMLFRTATFDEAYHPTGIRDQLQGRDYGQGFWSQQILGLQRFWHALNRRTAQEQ